MAGPEVPYYQISKKWKDRWAEFGLSPGGVCRAEAFPEELPRYQEWLEKDFQGEMSYLERHMPLKYDPPTLVPWVKSLIFFALEYYQDLPEAPEGEISGRVARYAWGRDYHKTLGNRLRTLCKALEKDHPGEVFRSFTDAGPLAERFYAQKSGLGFLGKHTLLIHPQRGSWFLLGEILSSLPPEHWSEEETPSKASSRGGCPSGCFRCGRVCPTGALLAPGLMDARRCISYLTIEHKGSLPRELRPLMGTWVFGCDLCQEVCPFNLKSEKTEEQDFLSWRLGPYLSLRELLSMDETAFEKKFAGTPAWRTGRRSLIRNACVAAGNSGDQSLVPLLEHLSSGDDELLAEHAAWALQRLQEGDREN